MLLSDLLEGLKHFPPEATVESIVKGHIHLKYWVRDSLIVTPIFVGPTSKTEFAKLNDQKNFDVTN